MPRICKKFEITKTIYSKSKRSVQFLKRNACFFNLFLELAYVQLNSNLDSYLSVIEWIHCSKMCPIFILGPDLSKRGMTAKMGIGNLDPDPVGDQGIVRIQEIERIPDPVLDRAVLWKMETKNQSSNIFCKKKTTTK